MLHSLSQTNTHVILLFYHSDLVFETGLSDENLEKEDETLMIAFGKILVLLGYWAEKNKAK